MHKRKKRRRNRKRKREKFRAEYITLTAFTDLMNPSDNFPKVLMLSSRFIGNEHQLNFSCWKMKHNQERQRGSLFLFSSQNNTQPLLFITQPSSWWDHSQWERVKPQSKMLLQRACLSPTEAAGRKKHLDE